MKGKNLSGPLTWISRAAGGLFIAFGLLALAIGLAGPKPIEFGAGGVRYYRLAVNSGAHPMLIGTVAVLLGLLLICLPGLLGKQSRQQRP